MEKGMNRNRNLIMTLLVLICGVNLCLSCSSLRDYQPPHGIILISLDTLRADHLGCYGYDRNTSPCIDAFARESVLFESAIVQSSWTLPSHMSIMTSLYPSFHGVTLDNYPLAEEHVTLAELLKKGGYQTAAFVDGGWVSAIFGFNQGFDVYDDEDKIGIARILPKCQEWINKHKESPFFLFIHCYDIHDPYDPPPPYDIIFHNFHYEGSFIPNTENLQAAAWEGLEVDDEDLRHIIALYDGGIRYTDEKVGELLSYLKGIDLYDQSLIIITSDHGEEFKEHGSFLHWQLYYKPNLHVPLIMSIPAYSRKGIRIKEFVQSIDILPTILKIAGLPTNPKAQGRSLVHLMEQYTDSFQQILCSVRSLFRRSSGLCFAEHHGTHDGKNYISTYEVSVISDDFYQMIYSMKSRSIQLFDIGLDPMAQRNIIERRNNIAEQMMLQFQKTFVNAPRYVPSTIPLDEKTRKQLKGLGYVP